MTVCVATICEDSQSVIGAADRMLTAGNVQFQPPAAKFYTLTTSVVLMVAGEMTVQAEIVTRMRARIAEMLSGTPAPDWIKVEFLAAMYADVFAEIKAKRGEADILKPLGLTLETFISRQAELSPQLVTSIATELIGKSMPGVGAIVAGIDRTGAHLFCVENGTVSCHDAAGFAAIGTGWYHANSHLMFSRHGKKGTLSRALLLTHTAKKRAEVAPGVGTDTDMFAVRGLGNYFEIGDHVMAAFEKRYAKAVVAHAKVEALAERKADEYITELLEPRHESGQAEQQVVEPATPSDEPADIAPINTRSREPAVPGELPEPAAIRYAPDRPAATE